ncbi:MAG: tryptophan-rich sensory protein [Kineosporiaceae bacterium]|nr:tryptophan-rich sensory protein [Kineosporiaceae bacterium]MBK7624244.1 tryptophan-rich sensory protein [Kineosporiaceae bacterium]MBK8075284.1 tryptophan-rich sensory protein [Kineosporiaceae bacterium]
MAGMDHARRVTVVIAEVFCVIGTLVGVGVLGTRVQEASGGALAADATLLAPAGPAFSIWSVIYLGLLGYTVWQALPSTLTSTRARTTGWLAAASMVLNAGWLLVTQQGWLWVSVGVIVALLAVLTVIGRRLAALDAAATSASGLERLVVDATFGLYLGWVAVATCANITATLVASGVDASAGVGAAIAVVVLAVAGGVGVLLMRSVGARWAVAAAMAWGLTWIAIGRTGDAPRSTVTAVTALIAAVAILAAAVAVGRSTTSRAGEGHDV